MNWPSDASVIVLIAKVSVACAVVLASTRLIRPSTRVRRWLWAFCFVLPFVYLLPTPRISIPLGEPLQPKSTETARVFELDPGFVPFHPRTVSDSGPGVWLLAFIVSGALGLGVLGIRLFGTVRLVRASEQVADSDVLELLYELAQHHQLDDVPVLKFSDAIDSPCAWGITQPVILLPTDFAAMPEAEWRLILDHEMAHIRHGDTWWMLGFATVRHFFWWNPLVGWAYREALLSHEAAIDERLAESPQYALLLQRYVQPATPGVSLRLRGQSHLLRRIREVSQPHRKRPAWSGVLAFAGVVPFAVPVETVAPYDPDPKRLGYDEVMFQSERTGKSRVWRAASDGRSPKPMSEVFADASMADVSPDGKWIAYAANRNGSADIYVARIDGTEERCIVRTPARESGTSWSPDGTRILYGTMETGNWEIGMVDLRTGKRTLVTNDGMRNLEPSWHPNGQRFVFSSHRSGEQLIWSMNLDGTGLVQLTSGGYEDTGASYSRDGRYLLFSAPRRAQYDVYLYDLRLGTYRVLSNLTLTDAGEARFVEGDQAVVMSAHDGNAFSLMRYDLRSRELKWLFPDKGLDHQVSTR